MLRSRCCGADAAMLRSRCCDAANEAGAATQTNVMCNAVNADAVNAAQRCRASLPRKPNPANQIRQTKSDAEPTPKRHRPNVRNEPRCNDTATHNADAHRCRTIPPNREPMRQHHSDAATPTPGQHQPDTIPMQCCTPRAMEPKSDAPNRCLDASHQ